MMEYEELWWGERWWEGDEDIKVMRRGPWKASVTIMRDTFTPPICLLGCFVVVDPDQHFSHKGLLGGTVRMFDFTWFDIPSLLCIKIDGQMHPSIPRSNTVVGSLIHPSQHRNSVSHDNDKPHDSCNVYGLKRIYWYVHSIKRSYVSIYMNIHSTHSCNNKLQFKLRP